MQSGYIQRCGAIRSSSIIDHSGSLDVDGDVGTHANVKASNQLTILGNVGSSVTIESGADIHIHKNVGTHSIIKSVGDTCIAGCAGSSTSITAEKALSVAGGVGTNSHVNAGKFECLRHISSSVVVFSQSEINVWEDVGTNSKLESIGDIKIGGSVNSSVRIITKGSVTISKNVGVNSVIKCDKTLTILGNVASSVVIQCSGTPTIKGSIGVNTVINGQLANSHRHQSSSSFDHEDDDGNFSISTVLSAGIATVTLNGNSRSYPAEDSVIHHHAQGRSTLFVDREEVISPRRSHQVEEKKAMPDSDASSSILGIFRNLSLSQQTSSAYFSSSNKADTLQNCTPGGPATSSSSSNASQDVDYVRAPGGPS